MARVLVIGWEGPARDEVVSAFDEDGHEVEVDLPKDSMQARTAYVWPERCRDLGDQPANSREVARVLSKTKATRDIPMVLYGVDAETEPRARTAAPRSVMIRERQPKAVMAAVKKAMATRTRDLDG